MTTKQRLTSKKTPGNKDIPVIKENGITGRMLNPKDRRDVKLYRKFRYLYWVKKFNFLKNLDTDDDSEQDKYDEHSVHFGAFDESDKLVGYVRFILPGSNGFQVYNEFEELVHPRIKDSHFSPQSVESSRLVVAPELGPRRRDVAKVIYKLQYQYFKRNGFKYWYHVSELKLIRALRLQNYPFKIIGKPKEYQGASCYPAFVDLDELDSFLLKKNPKQYQWLNEGIEE